MKKIKVIIKRPGEKPHSTWISNSLKNLQLTVDGHIETVTVTPDMVIICNEEGRIRELPYNCTVAGIDFVGTVIFAGVKDDEFADIPYDYQEFRQNFWNIYEPWVTEHKAFMAGLDKVIAEMGEDPI